MARTVKEKAIDRLLTLYVIDRCKTKHGIDNVSETKLHKLLFYSMRKMNQQKCKALNYRFVKLLYPTFSQELRGDLNDLAELGFLSGPYFSEERKAQMIIEDFGHVLSNNGEILDIIDSEVDRYAPIQIDELVKRTKRLPWRYGKTIAGLNNGTPLVYPLSEEKTRCQFVISESDYEDLAICLNPKISAEMEQAFDEMRRGKLLTHAEVFGEI
jgi:hypothetical protein